VYYGAWSETFVASFCLTAPLLVFVCHLHLIGLLVEFIIRDGWPRPALQPAICLFIIFAINSVQYRPSSRSSSSSSSSYKFTV